MSAESTGACTNCAQTAAEIQMAVTVKARKITKHQQEQLVSLIESAAEQMGAIREGETDVRG